MAINEIKPADIVNRGVIGLADVPGLTTAEMQKRMDELATDVIIPKVNELVKSANATNESLAQRNLRTYTGFAQINESYSSSNFSYKDMPSSSMLSVVLSTTGAEAAYENNLIPVKRVGELIVLRAGGRGSIEFHDIQGNTHYAFVTYGELTSNADVVWDSYALNSDLPQYKDLTLTFSTADSVGRRYASINSEIPSGFAPISVVSMYDWLDFYLVYRNGNDWSVFAQDVSDTASVRVWFAKV